MRVGAACSEPRSGFPASPSAGRAECREQILQIAQIHLAFGLVPPPLSAFRMTPVIAARRALGTGLVDFTPVVPSPLFGIGQQVVSRGNRLEACFRLWFPGVQIRVKLLGELAVDLADLVRA